MEKINELTNKIYQEGVEKGKAAADALISQAKSEAQSIIEQAQREAERLLAEAQKEAEELNTRTKAELKMYATQAVDALKGEVATSISDNILKQGVKQTAENKDFLGQFLVALASQWDAQQPMVVSSEKAEELKAYCATHARHLLDGGLSFNKVNGADVLFSIAPADGAYRIDFGQEEFMNFLKAFVRPQLMDLLF